MQLSLRHVLGTVSWCTVLFAGIKANLTLPAGFANLPEGVLFLLTLGMVGFQIARAVATVGRTRAFAQSFLITLAVFGAISMSQNISATNTLPEHTARYFSRFRLDKNENVHDSNERFFSLIRLLNLATASTTGLVSGAVASRMLSHHQRDEMTGKKVASDDK